MKMEEEKLILFKNDRKDERRDAWVVDWGETLGTHNNRRRKHIKCVQYKYTYYRKDVIGIVIRFH